MKRKLVWLGVFLLVLVTVRTASGQVAPAAGGATAWFVETIESTANLGQYVSAGIRPDTGALYISYYDASQGDLRVAHYVGSGGNCGPRSDWRCETVDGYTPTNTDVGHYSSLAFDPVSSYPGVAYYDATNYSLKYAAYWCTPHGCSWSIIPVDQGNADGSLQTGRFASLKYDSSRKPHITYQRYVPSTNWGYLYHAYPVDSGGNCGPVNGWRCELIQGGLYLGEYTSLALSAGDTPYVAYYDRQNQDLRYAWRKAPGTGNCGPGDLSWQCITIDSSGDVGRHASLRLGEGSGDPVRIAYYSFDSTTPANSVLKLASFVDSGGGNCGPGNDWQCDVIDAIGGSGGDVGVSLAANSANTPYIAYGCPGCAGTSIRLAHWVGLTGNCGPTISFPGPTPIMVHTWQCEDVVSSIAAHALGSYVSLAINSADLMSIAYYDATPQDLMLAQQRQLVFLPIVLRDFEP